VAQKEIEESKKQETEETKCIAQVHEAKDAISQSLQKVSERGDKIKSLDQKMRDMSERSRNFAEMAAELARKEKNKKWWQL
jgi:hypothetical protein